MTALTKSFRYSTYIAGVAFASSVLLGQSASAADFAPPPPIVETYSWSGIYLGGHVGGGQAFFDGGYDLADTSSSLHFEDLTTTGVLAGAHAGFNWDLGTFVLGVEGDVSFMDWKDGVSAPASSEEATADVDLLASVRGRLGMPIGADRRGMIYATGGVAFADAKARVFEDGRAAATDRFSFDFDDLGGVAGGGFEWAATNSVRVRVESLYYFFSDRKAGNLNEAAYDFELDDVWTVRAGVSISLGNLFPFGS